MRTIRSFLLFEAGLFLMAAAVHAGAIAGYEHFQARVAETVIGVVLLVALAMTFTRASWTRTIAMAAQGFALLGTLVGLLASALGVGPGTGPDVVFHAVMIFMLAWGLTLASRPSSRRRAARA